MASKCDVMWCDGVISANIYTVYGLFAYDTAWKCCYLSVMFILQSIKIILGGE